MTTHNHSSSSSEEQVLRAFEKEWFEECKPVLDLSIRPTCSPMHELDVFASPQISLLSMEGSWRSVWKVVVPFQEKHHHDDSSSIITTIIFKALHLHRTFDAESFEHHNMDSLAMERLTSSPHVVSSFGFCGQSVLTQFANNTGRTLIKDPTLSWKTRLRLARDLARGLAELHAFRRLDFSSSNSSTINNQSSRHQDLLYFSHYDINVANTVSLSARTIQWNDFNLGILSRQKKNSPNNHNTNNQQQQPSSSCRVPIRFDGPLWRSPEEITNTTPGSLMQLQSSDVYSLGNLLFQILTKHQPWTHLEEGPKKSLLDIAELKLKGQLPNLSSKYMPQRPEAHVLWKATQACFRLEPSQRPSAWELARALGTAYEWLFQQKQKQKNGPITQEAIQELFAVK
jgi:hypothetical protein